MKTPMSEPSPWGGFRVWVVPDDDAEAEAAGFPADLVAELSPDGMLNDGVNLFVRATTWARVKDEFRALGMMH